MKNNALALRASAFLSLAKASCTVQVKATGLEGSHLQEEADNNLCMTPCTMTSLPNLDNLPKCPQIFESMTTLAYGT